MLIRKMLSESELEFLQKCRSHLEQLTGEEFNTIALSYVDCDIEVDYYSPKLKIALNYVDEHAKYYLPGRYACLYKDRYHYNLAAEYIDYMRMIGCIADGILVIHIPLIEADRIRYYLVRELHRLTKYRVWVGSPVK